MFSCQGLRRFAVGAAARAHCGGCTCEYLPELFLGCNELCAVLYEVGVLLFGAGILLFEFDTLGWGVTAAYE